MLNLVERFMAVVNGNEDIMNILTDKEFVDVNSYASVEKTDSGFVVSYDESAINVATDGTITSIKGDITNDVAARAISIIFLTTEFNQEDNETVIDFLDEINNKNEWCGSTPFEVMCDWEDINPSGNAHSLLEMHRTGNLRFGAIKVPENWNQIRRSQEKAIPNPEKIERRTRIW